MTSDQKREWAGRMLAHAFQEEDVSDHLNHYSWPENGVQHDAYELEGLAVIFVDGSPRYLAGGRGRAAMVVDPVFIVQELSNEIVHWDDLPGHLLREIPDCST